MCIRDRAMGVGNFFGLLPESMAGSRLYGVEPVSYTHLDVYKRQP